jgi:SAM-dependent methyltransferase
MIKDNIKLNLGSGPTVPDGWIGIDLVSKSPNVIQRDIARGIPLQDETCTEILADNFLEHVKQDDYIFVWNEMWRVLKPGGKLTIIVPRANSEGADQDPTHVRRFQPMSFSYFCVEDDNHAEPCIFLKQCRDYGFVGAFARVEHDFFEQGSFYHVTLEKVVL